jgi:L-2-hydroxyglutarate oxidase LhgO
MSDCDALVIGAGVVGLAIARALARQGQSVIVLEQNEGIGMETSSRNSEVIHAGLYYPTGSLKAQLCVEGKKALYDFCAAYHVPHRRCGKLIVAVNENEIAAIDAIRQKGIANGVDDLIWLSADEARQKEPSLSCVAALYSPSTGIIDSHAYMLALQGDIEAHGGSIAFKTGFHSARVVQGGFAVTADGDVTLITTRLINAGGLHASRVARAIEGLAPDLIPETRYAKGNYFSLAKKAPFTHLIYPAPHTHGLGVHLTLDMGGAAKFGPDVEWVDEIAYEVDPRRGDSFYAAIRTYWPDLPDDALQPSYSGIRPKICGPHDPAADFRVDSAEVHGIPHLVNLFGVESPGLTSSLAIAARVSALLS